MIAVVVGSTGLVGSILVKKLLNDEAISRVISVSRSSLQLDHSKLNEVLITDLEQIPTQADKLKGDLYFCCLGTTIKSAGSKERFHKVDYDAVVAFGKVASLHQARSFTLVSATGANARSAIFYNQVKGETEAALIDLKLKSLNIYRPSLLMGERREFRLAEKIFIEVLKPIYPLLPSGLSKRLVTEVETLAERMLVQGKAAAIGTHVVEAVAI